MRKLLLSAAVVLSLSGCATSDIHRAVNTTVDNFVDNLVDGILGPGGGYASHDVPHGLRPIRQVAEIDQAYFQNHKKEIIDLLIDAEYYRVSEYAFEKITRSWIRRVTELDERINDLQRSVHTIQAPASYEECLEFIGAFNRYGPVNIGCYKSIQRQYTPAQRQQLTQQTRARLADELARLRKQRSQLHQEASNAGAYSALPAARKQAGRQRRAIQEKLDMHCERLLKAPQVSWVQTHPSSSSRGKTVGTAVKGRSDCAYAVFYGFHPHEGFVDTAKLRFDSNYGYKLNMSAREIRELLRHYQ